MVMDLYYFYCSWTSGLSIGLIVMFVIFIAYTVIPDLKNFHGMIIRAYVITEIATYAGNFGRTVLYYHRVKTDSLFDSSNGDMNRIALAFSVIVGYFSLSSLFWLTAMSFDVWWESRVLRPVKRQNEKYEKKRFIWYAIFAWTIPAVLFLPSYVSAVDWDYLYIDHHELRGIRHLVIWGGSIAIGVICTISLYIATLRLIRQQKKDITNLNDDMNDQHNANKQWLSLQKKLFILMAGPAVVTRILTIAAQLLPESPELLSRLSVSYGPLWALESIIMSIILLWNDKVKKWLCEKRDRSSNFSEAIRLGQIEC